MDNSKVKNDKDGVIQENGTKETPSPIGDSEKPNPDLRDSDDETDGIRGWIVVFASFMVQFIEDGVFFSFGLFFVEISKEFSSVGKQGSSWIASIMIAVTHAFGPISSILVNKFGCRVVSIIGTFIVALGYGLSYFAQNVDLLYFTIGVVGGIGFSCVYLPAIVIVPKFFTKRRALAVGISVCGSGIGILSFEQIFGWMLAHYPWRESLAMTGGIVLLTAVFAILYGSHNKSEESDEETGRTTCNNLKKMIDLSLLTHTGFVLFSICDMFASMAFNVPYVYLPEIEKNEVGAHSKSTLLGIIGITNIIGRVLFGWISDQPCVNRLYLYNVTLIIAGIGTIVSQHLRGIWLLRGYAGLFGTCIGTYTSLRTVILVDLIGLDKFNDAFGIFMLVQAVGFVIGPPIVGGLYDMYHTYTEGFYFAGAAFVLSGLLLFTIPCVQRWKSKQNGNQDTSSESR